MPKYSFAFGPNGEYFFSTTLAWNSQGLQESLRERLLTDVQASKHFVSLGVNGEYFYARHNGRRTTWTCKNNRDKEKVNEWLIEHQQNCIIQFSFGPGNTYVACTPQGACKWSSSLSPNVKRNIYRFHPVMATLGVGDAYVLVDGEGKFKWNLKGRYDQLDQILTKSDLAIEMVVLNPYAEKQYIIIFKTGTWRALLPLTYLDKIKEMLQKQDESDCQIIAMQTRAMEQNQRIAIQGMQNIMTMNANALSNLFIQ